MNGEKFAETNELSTPCTNFASRPRTYKEMPGAFIWNPRLITTDGKSGELGGLSRAFFDSG